MLIDWTQLGAAAGAVGVVYLLGRLIERVLKMFFADRREDRRTWENHLSDYGRSQRDIAVILQTLVDQIEDHRKATEK